MRCLTVLSEKFAHLLAFDSVSSKEPAKEKLEMSSMDMNTFASSGVNNEMAGFNSVWLSVPAYWETEPEQSHY